VEMKTSFICWENLFVKSFYICYTSFLFVVFQGSK